MTLAAYTWKLDPVLVDFGPMQIRFYGLVFAITLLLGYWLWRRQMLRGGCPDRIADGFLVWGVVAVIAGARLGHVLFYRWDDYSQRPLEILFFWRGGLASHGATIGLILALALYARYHRLSVLETMDRFAPSAAIGAAGIRLGNFLNSEIVGRVTDVPWAVRFPLYERNPLPRHPSQLYEFALGAAVLAALLIADRRAGRENRPRGLMTGLFLTFYFAGRFCVEFFKEYHTLRDSALTMGQYLSIVPFLAGVALLTWTARTRVRSTGRRAASPQRRNGAGGGNAR